MSYVAIFSSVTSMVINRERKNNLKSISSLVFTQAWSCVRYMLCEGMSGMMIRCYVYLCCNRFICRHENSRVLTARRKRLDDIKNI
jgi:hypothetical protein